MNSSAEQSEQDLRLRSFIIWNVKVWINTPLYNNLINISPGIINTGLTSFNQWDQRERQRKHGEREEEGKGGKEMKGETHS